MHFWTTTGSVPPPAGSPGSAGSPGGLTMMMHSPLHGSGLVPGGQLTGGSVAKAGAAPQRRAPTMPKAPITRLNTVAP